MERLLQNALPAPMAGGNAELERRLRDMLRADPRNLAVLQSLGALASGAKKDDQALKYFQRAVKLAPRSVDLWIAIGRTLLAMGYLHRASSAFTKATKVDSQSVTAHQELASVLHSLGRYESAVMHYRQVLALSGPEGPTLNNLGVAYRDMHREEAAFAAFSQAITLDPTSAPIQSNMGSILLEKGSISEAVTRLERACELAPSEPVYLYNLAEAKRFTHEDPSVGLILRRAEELRDLDDAQRTHLHFALAKIHDDLGNFAEAAKYVTSANALKRAQIAYDEMGYLGDMRSLSIAYDQDIIDRLAGTGDPTHLPIFIVGMPRSGSTLVAQILSSHSRVHGAGEVDVFGEQISALAKRDRRGLGLPPAAEVADRLDQRSLLTLGQRYRSRLAEYSPHSDRIIDKLLANFRCVGLIHLALPNARIIHVRRNPFDTALSCYFKLFQGEHPYSYDLAELGRYYRAYSDLMVHWRRILPAGVMLEVDYEDVVDDLERAAQRMIEFCGMEWEPACLEFHTNKRWVKTASAAQVRRPLYRSAVGRSEHYRELLAPFAAELDRP